MYDPVKIFLLLVHGAEHREEVVNHVVHGIDHHLGFVLVRHASHAKPNLTLKRRVKDPPEHPRSVPEAVAVRADRAEAASLNVRAAQGGCGEDDLRELLVALVLVDAREVQPLLQGLVLEGKHVPIPPLAHQRVLRVGAVRLDRLLECRLLVAVAARCVVEDLAHGVRVERAGPDRLCPPVLVRALVGALVSRRRDAVELVVRELEGHLQHPVKA
mmetsp:Transcript_8229/g.19173  ORF Transcript_8229/g.19173 Transcript_8229/m.19173 type:complete len:215 (+) Transcript_8229:224-868(+)